MSLATTHPATSPRSDSTEASDPLLPCVLFLNGYPDGGNTSIARQLSDLIPNMEIIDDFVLRKLVPEAVGAGRGSRRGKLRGRIRTAILDQIEGIKDSSVTIVVTSYIDSRSNEQLKEYIDLAAHRNVPFILYTVTCDVPGYSAPMRSPMVTTSSRSELTNTREALQIRENKGLVLPDAKVLGDRHRFLNMSHKSASEAAHEVLAFLSLVCNPQAIQTA